MKKTITIALDEKVLERAQQFADRENRSRSNWIEQAIRSKVRETEAEESRIQARI